MLVAVLVVVVVDVFVVVVVVVKDVDVKEVEVEVVEVEVLVNVVGTRPNIADQISSASCHTESHSCVRLSSNSVQFLDQPAYWQQVPICARALHRTPHASASRVLGSSVMPLPEFTH